MTRHTRHRWLHSDADHRELLVVHSGLGSISGLAAVVAVKHAIVYGPLLVHRGITRYGSL